MEMSMAQNSEGSYKKLLVFACKGVLWNVPFSESESVFKPFHFHGIAIHIEHTFSFTRKGKKKHTVFSSFAYITNLVFSLIPFYGENEIFTIEKCHEAENRKAENQKGMEIEA